MTSISLHIDLKRVYTGLINSHYVYQDLHHREAGICIWLLFSINSLFLPGEGRPDADWADAATRSAIENYIHY
jgi:hypothetical protein